MKHYFILSIAFITLSICNVNAQEKGQATVVGGWNYLENENFQTCGKGVRDYFDKVFLSTLKNFKWDKQYFFFNKGKMDRYYYHNDKTIIIGNKTVEQKIQTLQYMFVVSNIGVFFIRNASNTKGFECQDIWSVRF